MESQLRHLLSAKHARQMNDRGACDIFTKCDQCVQIFRINFIVSSFLVTNSQRLINRSEFINTALLGAAFLIM